MKKIKKSTIILIIIVFIYTILSFINLGDTNSPQTYKTYKASETSYIRLSKEANIDRINIFMANYISDFSVYLISSTTAENNNFSLSSSKNDQLNALHKLSLSSQYALDTQSVDYGDVFKWLQFDVDSEDTFSYIVIKSYKDNTAIGEISAFDKDGSQINLEALSMSDNRLTDEQNLAPYIPSYMNGTYFDEVYHARTAYEQLHDIDPYECVHPPLGKIIISIPIALFGMTPFNYRLMGNIAGILMIIVMYFIGKTLFKKEKYGLIAATIMALDGMHFAQTRIATVDSFLVLFCLLSFLFMIRYIYMDDNAPNKKKLLNLFFSGIFIGMAISTKWTAFFVGLGLAIIFFMHFIYKNLKYTSNHGNLELHFSFNKEHLKLLLYCVLFFIIIPICIYLISYIPLFLNKGCPIKDFSSFIQYQKDIYEYHSTLQDTHPFTSPWYSWPIMYKPMWYEVSYYPNNMISTISCFGNPLIWWVGIATTVFSIIYSIVKKKKECITILVLIATTWLTYMFIGRLMFIYHYFITLPFVMLSIVYFMKILDEKIKKKFIANSIIIFIIAIFLIAFIYFYPIFSGHIVSENYIEQTKWFSSWIY